MEPGCITSQGHDRSQGFERDVAQEDQLIRLPWLQWFGNAWRGKEKPEKEKSCMGASGTVVLEWVYIDFYLI